MTRRTKGAHKKTVKATEEAHPGRQILARNLRALRAVAGATQEEISERTGLSQQHLSDLERGSRSCGLDTLEKLSLGFGIEIKDLFQDTVNTKKAP